MTLSVWSKTPWVTQIEAKSDEAVFCASEPWGNIVMCAYKNLDWEKKNKQSKNEHLWFGQMTCKIKQNEITMYGKAVIMSRRAHITIEIKNSMNRLQQQFRLLLWIWFLYFYVDSRMKTWMAFTSYSHIERFQVIWWDFQSIFIFYFSFCDTIRVRPHTFAATELREEEKQLCEK